MAQLFPRWSNTWARAGLACLPLVASIVGWVTYATVWSPYITRVGVPLEQPVPFSHQHHVTGLGLDCRYCHTSVENSAFAGMPSTHTCMTCHSHVWSQAPVLAPVRESFMTRTPLRWNRVNDLPDFVSFDHSIHVRKGVGCSSCHGNVGQMPLTWKTETLYMKWCLDCHRNPSPHIRPKSQLFALDWQARSGRRKTGDRAPGRNERAQLTDCSICHR